MKTPILRFTLYVIIAYLTGGTPHPAVAAPQPLWGHGTPFCGVIDSQWSKRDSDQYPNRRYAHPLAANLSVGDPRTVRLIYFLPNDRPYRAEMVQKMKDDILNIQTFYAEQMGVHGYGEVSFRIETDLQGEPKVHRVDGGHPDRHYLGDTHYTVRAEIAKKFDVAQNIYFVVVDNSIDGIVWGGGQVAKGVGGRVGKNGGIVLKVPDLWLTVAAHELGHAFGLWHDFRDGAYIMSYGPGMNRLSACHAEYLSAHPYFNPDTPIEKGPPPSIELISSHIYPAESKSVHIRLRISDSDELHLALLHAEQPNNRTTVKSCRGLRGKNERVVDFDYDGVIPSAREPSNSIIAGLLDHLVHPIRIEAVDMNGNVDSIKFMLLSDALQPLSKISGDNQHGLPNTPLPVPFVVEVWDLNDGSVRNGVPVTFTVTAGGGTLSRERTETDGRGRAESLLTLGPHLGVNTVEFSAAGVAVTFTAVAGVEVDIPDPNLRAAIETTLNKSMGEPIAPAEMATLTRLEARNANISDLTGLEFATNLKFLWLLGEQDRTGVWSNSNSVSDLSPLAGLIHLEILNLRRNSVSDISALVGLTNLTNLDIGGNDISDISALASLTKLEWLFLTSNSVIDISAVAGLTNLTDLDIGGNDISDISALASLTKLEWLVLHSNNISDLSPLVANSGVGNGDELYVRLNPLSYQSISTHIPIFQSKGVAFEFDNRPHPALLKISGDNQKGASYASLSQPFVIEAQDENGSALTGISVTFAVTGGGGTLSVKNTTTDENGRAQSTLILGANLGTNTVRVSAAGIESTATFYAIADSELPPTTADVNTDGSVDVLDLIMIASSLGQVGQSDADVNGDGVVSILDLVLVAGALGTSAAAPSLHPQSLEMLTAGSVRQWLSQAQQLAATDPAYLRGITMLEQLLTVLAPKETTLLPNYPNPFNPETWIPYRLAEDAFVTLIIYDSRGQVVRTLNVGHQIAAFYESRSKAIYWNGRNEFGEQVASGVYFYHLSADDFSATRKMLIIK